VVEVQHYGGFADELVVDALVINGRRFFSTVGLVVLHDVGLVDRLDCPRVNHFVVCVTLQAVGVVLPFDLRWIHFGAVPEDQDGGGAIGGTEHGPIGLTGFRELAFNDVVAALDIRHLWNGAAAALKIHDDRRREFGKSGWAEARYLRETRMGSREE